MAGASLLTLLDDIATILDDVALMTKVAAKKSAVIADDVGVMTKVAAKKTAGVLGDDLALNAQQVTGVQADRETARGLGGGQGFAAQQGHPGAGRPC
jgi:predicted DNA repair protein MutK